MGWIVDNLNSTSQVGNVYLELFKQIGAELNNLIVANFYHDRGSSRCIDVGVEKFRVNT